MTSRNLSTSDLTFNNNVANQNFNDDGAMFGLTVTVTTESESEFLYITSIVCYGATKEIFEKKMNRYVDLAMPLTEEELDSKLAKLQYYCRKEIKLMYEVLALDVKLAQEAEVVTIEEEVAPATFLEPTMKDNGKIVAPATTPKVGLEATIFEYVKEGIESPESLETVKYFIKSTLDELGVVPGKLEHIVSNPEKDTKINMGTQHVLFGRVLKSISAKVNIALVGPAGSGKTTAVINAAKALDLPFYSKSLSEHTGVHEFFGYQDAHGNYVTTDFRNAYEFGGVWLGDEFDNSNPNVLSAINQASENEVVSFPDGMVKRHKDFVCIMAGNTYGHGATSEYVGRNPIDAATLDRFVFLYFGYDEAMETELATNKVWCSKVQLLRAKVATKKIKTIISPRATFNGAKLLAAGLTEQEVMEMVIYKGMQESEIAMLA